MASRSALKTALYKSAEGEKREELLMERWVHWVGNLI